MKVTIDVVFFWISFWGYLVSFFLFALHLAIKRKWIAIIALSVFIVGFVFLTSGIVARIAISSRPTFATMYEFALIVSWITSLLTIVAYGRTRSYIYTLMVSPMVVVIMVIASFLPKNITEHLLPTLRGYWFYIHVTLAAISEGAFLLSAGAGVYYLIIRKRDKLEDGPSLEKIEEVISRAIRFGYPLFTIGALFAGAIWAQTAWGSFWSWDPKETGSLVVWLYYTLLLHQEFRARWRKGKLALMSIIGFIVIIISFIGNLFFGGLHSYI